MNSVGVWCSQCGDEYSPVEYRPAAINEVNFCSLECEEEYGNSVGDD